MNCLQVWLLSFCTRQVFPLIAWANLDFLSGNKQKQTKKKNTTVFGADKLIYIWINKNIALYSNTSEQSFWTHKTFFKEAEVSFRKHVYKL